MKEVARKEGEALRAQEERTSASDSEGVKEAAVQADDAAAAAPADGAKEE